MLDGASVVSSEGAMAGLTLGHATTTFNMQPVDLMRVPVNQLTDEQKQHMIIDERFTFFQIENKLRQICQDAVDNFRVRMNREGELVRKIQTIAEAAKRDVLAYEPRIVQALQANAMVLKALNEIAQLENNLRVVEERVHNQVDVMETSMTIMEGKMQTQVQQHNIEMSKAHEMRRDVTVGLK